MAAGAIYPVNAASLLSMGDQFQALQATPASLKNASPQDVVSISNAAREAHAAAALFDSAGFLTTVSAGPAVPNPAPFEKVVAAVQYQQVQSLLETGTTAFRPGSVASTTG